MRTIVPLERVDVLETLFPDSIAHQVASQLLAFEQLGVHPDDENVLVIRSVEDRNLALGGQHFGGPPQEVVRDVFVGRHLEGHHAGTLWIESAHHVSDQAVLAAGIHPLQHEQQRVPPVGVEKVLQLEQPAELPLQVGLAALFGSEGTGVGRIVCAERIARAGGHAERGDIDAIVFHVSGGPGHCTGRREYSTNAPSGLRGR